MGLLRRALIPAALLLALFAAVIVSFSVAANALEPGVTEAPRSNTMQVVNGEVLDSIIVGNRIIVAGTFTQVRDVNGNTISQAYLAAYNADTGRFDGSFRPDIDNFVNAVDSNSSCLLYTSPSPRDRG